MIIIFQNYGLELKNVQQLYRKQHYNISPINGTPPIVYLPSIFKETTSKLSDIPAGPRKIEISEFGGDNCATHHIFYILYQPNYLISLMTVNESEEVFATFVDRYPMQFSDKIFRVQNRFYAKGPLVEKDTEPDQQFDDAPLSYNEPGSIGNGLVVKFISKGTYKRMVVVHGFCTSSGKKRYKISNLNEKKYPHPYN